MEIWMRGTIPIQILVTHATTATARDEEKDAYYDKLQEATCQTGFADTIILGDMNAKLLSRREDETRIMGEHILGDAELLWAQSDITRDNRTRFTSYCEYNELYIQNTKFQKQDANKCTYREPTTNRGPPWDAHRYAEIDFIVNRQRWKNNVLNVQSDPMANVDSDHFPVWAVYRTRLKRTRINAEERTRYEDPTTEQKREFDEQIRAELGKAEGETGKLEKWTEALRSAAKATLQRAVKHTTGPRIREGTWRLIREREQMIREHRDAEIKEITKRIRKEARKDKRYQRVK